eukprot:957727-Amphidinium_carterae.1
MSVSFVGVGSCGVYTFILVSDRISADEGLNCLRQLEKDDPQQVKQTKLHPISTQIASRSARVTP